jgi:hypothetical protein
MSGMGSTVNLLELAGLLLLALREKDMYWPREGKLCALTRLPMIPKLLL